MGANTQEDRVPVFKTNRFGKDARKARITDAMLCEAIRQVIGGQVDDMGGGVFKKRLNDNMHRAILLAKADRHWIFEYLYAKKDRSNIEADELAAFRLLSKSYAKLTALQLAQLVSGKHFVEICHGNDPA